LISQAVTGIKLTGSVSGDKVLVIGAGPAGLAVAGTASRAGLEVEVLEATEAVASSWRRHYDRLHLHTTRRLSGLPGLPIPDRMGTWVARDDFVAYLEQYAGWTGVEIRFGSPVERIEAAGGEGWRLRLGKRSLKARQVVVATGYNHTPYLPRWPGRADFAGQVMHSSAYRNPRPFKGRDVLVVGTGNSGAEIAQDLAEHGAGKVWIAIRTPPNIVRRDVVGPLKNQHLGLLAGRLPVSVGDWISLQIVQRLAIGDLSRYGVPPPKKGAATRVREEQIPLIDVGFLSQLKARRIQGVPALERFDGGEAICGDQRLRPQVVIAATGYTRGLKRLVGHLRVLGPTERPTHHAPQCHPATPGLYFIGFSNPITGNLYEVARDARALARALVGARRSISNNNLLTLR
jgi:putative flavoprotein involved in K+ transport